MSSTANRTLNLETLADGVPVMPPEAVGFYKHNCMVCFHNQGHRSGVGLLAEHEHSTRMFEVKWIGDVTAQILRAYGDMVKATEHAACAMAFLLVKEVTNFTAVEQSPRGTTIDYYLAPSRQDHLIFNHSARLEVSGILREDEGNTVDGRIRSKLTRLKEDEGLETYIIVVEFSRPWSKLVKA